MNLYRIQSQINMKLVCLLFIVIILSGCSTPVAVVCPPFPSPPSVLMQPPPTQFLLDNALKPRSN